MDSEALINVILSILSAIIVFGFLIWIEIQLFISLFKAVKSMRNNIGKESAKQINNYSNNNYCDYDIKNLFHKLPLFLETLYHRLSTISKRNPNRYGIDKTQNLS